MVVAFGEFDWHDVVFQHCKNIQDVVQDGRESRMYIVESHGFLLYTALKKRTYFFHNGNVFFVCFCSGNRIHQSMHYFQDYLWLDLIIQTYISYYSHKSSYFGQTFCQEIMK